MIRSSVAVSASFPGTAAKPGARTWTIQGASRTPASRHHRQHDRERAEDLRGQRPRRALPVPGGRPREGGNERRRERAFSQELAQRAGNPEGHEERIGHHARAEEPGDGHVPHEPEDAAEEGRQADDPRRRGDLPNGGGSDGGPRLSHASPAVRAGARNPLTSRHDSSKRIGFLGCPRTLRDAFIERSRVDADHQIVHQGSAPNRAADCPEPGRPGEVAVQLEARPDRRGRRPGRASHSRPWRTPCP